MFDWLEDGHEFQISGINFQINLGGLSDVLIIQSQGDMIFESEEIVAGKYRIKGKNDNFWLTSASGTFGIGIHCGPAITTSATAGDNGSFIPPTTSTASPSNATLDAIFGTSNNQPSAMGIIDDAGTPSIVIFNNSNGLWYQFNHDSTI